MNNNIFIEDNDLDLVKAVFKDIKQVENQDRIIANALGARVAVNYFEGYDVDVNSGLHNMGKVLEIFDISDIYVNENYIDVRLYFNDNELSVPKSHFDAEILPVAYMFIKLNEDLTEGVVAGFIRPSDINTSKEIGGYYQIKEEDLVSFYDVEASLLAINLVTLTSDFEAKVYDFVGGKLENLEEILPTLVASKQAREFLKDVFNVSNAFNFISNAELETNAVVQEFQNDESLEDFIDNSVQLNFDANVEELTVDSEDTFDLNIDSEIVALESVEDVNLIEEVETVENEVVSQEENLLENFVEDLSEDFIEDALETDTVPIQQDVVVDNFLVEELKEETVVEEEDLFTEIDTVDFSTNTTPSLNDLEQDLSKEEELDSINNELDSEDQDFVGLDDFEDSNNLEETTIEESFVEQDENIVLDNEESLNEHEADKNEEINDLFGFENSNEEVSEEVSVEDYQEEDFYPPKRKSNIIPFLGILVVLAGVGYGLYKMNVFNQVKQPATSSQDVVGKSQKNKQVKVKTEEAMPVETIENVSNISKTNEGIAVSVPAIEQNLDASILVSNLSINWEVPSAYISNPVAKRYFSKLGKIIQLNLKTELLLLSKPPITNKIVLELEYDKNAKVFNIKDLTTSSGESSVDELVKKIVNGALALKLNTNMSIFSTIQGNPTLVIHL